LGRTGLEVTVLGYGAMEIRGPRIWSGRDLTDDQADRILNAVLDAGINFIDTAYDYGRSEEYIGRFISRRRDEYYLATKCGCTVVDAGDHDETPHVWTRENITARLEESLRRMKTDYVDLLQLHNPSVEQVEQGDLVQVLKDLQAAGKTRWIGCSATLPHLATYVEWGVFDAFQIPYSALERRHEGWISRAAEAGAGIHYPRWRRARRARRRGPGVGRSLGNLGQGRFGRVTVAGRKPHRVPAAVYVEPSWSRHDDRRYPPAGAPPTEYRAGHGRTVVPRHLCRGEAPAVCCGGGARTLAVARRLSAAWLKR